MSDNRRDWLKWIETCSALIAALATIAVPIMLYVYGERVAEQGRNTVDQQRKIDQQNTQIGLVISTVPLLADENTFKRQGGFAIIKSMQANGIYIPREISDIAAAIAQAQPATAKQITPTESAATPPVTVASPVEQFAQDVSEALAGVVPRVFIHIASEDQRPTAGRLREAIQQFKAAIDGRLVIAPGVERVAHSPSEIELRYLKAGDGPEATELASQIDGLLSGQMVVVKNFSGPYDANPKVKRRTYELWFPPGQIALR